MRFTPALFVAGAAASVYWPAESSSTVATTSSSSSAAWGKPKATSSSSSSSSSVGWGYDPATSSSSSAAWGKGLKTSTIYSTAYWTVTACAETVTDCPAHATKVVSSVWAVSTAVDPVKPKSTGAWDIPYCSAVTETCTVTVTASSTPAAPVKPSTPAAPVYPVKGSSTASWPSGTGSPVKPYPSQFTGAASAQKAGAVLAGAGAIAAMLF